MSFQGGTQVTGPRSIPVGGGSMPVTSPRSIEEVPSDWFLGGTPLPDEGYPSPRQGSTPVLGYPLVRPILRAHHPTSPSLTEQQSEYLLCCGRYASCVHAGGLSCLKIKFTCFTYESCETKTVSFIYYYLGCIQCFSLVHLQQICYHRCHHLAPRARSNLHDIKRQRQCQDELY